MTLISESFEKTSKTLIESTPDPIEGGPESTELSSDGATLLSIREQTLEERS